MNTGKVWLVGAGPGDAGLFTRKGYEVLQQADVVVYDSLVGDGVLAMIPESARKINAGKRSSHHTMPQWKMNELLLEEAQKGNRVVRLKGGDPFLFGRGGEELELLAEHQIPFEVVPGITSPLAVPAYNGIPVTHRDYTSSLHIITGHKKEGQAYDINFRALVETEGTLVFLMGVASLPDICKGLTDAGMDPQMPAAVLQKGTTAGQKRIVATVSTLQEKVERQGVETPAIIVVGKVCSLADTFAWYEKLPLAGCKILVTRPKALISSMSRRLRVMGAEVLEIPAVETRPIRDSRSLENALGILQEYSWIVLTSPTGVKVFFDRLLESGKDIRSLASARFAVIGEGPAKALRARGIRPDLMPAVYDGDHLGAELAKRIKEDNPDGTEKILIPRAEKGNHSLAEQLREAGAQVDDIPTYQTIYRKQDVIDVKREFEEGRIFCAAFTSSSIVRAFVQANEGLDFTKVRAACIGKQTKATADSFGMQTEMAEKATMDDLAELICRMWNASGRL